MYNFPSSIFASVSAVVSSVASIVRSTATPVDPLYAYFQDRGVEACIDQVALMKSWRKTPPESALVRQTLIDLLAHSMTDPHGSLEHKLLCTLWISKFDANAGHAERIAPILTLLNSDHLDDQSHTLFSVFAEELSQDHWDTILDRMLPLIDGTKIATAEQKKQALLILAIGFPHFDEPEQNEIIESLITIMKSVDGQLPAIAVEALGNLHIFNTLQRARIINEFYVHFSHTDEQFRSHLGKGLGKLFADAWDTEQEKIIEHCTLLKNSNNYRVRQSAYHALGAIVSRANEEQRIAINATTVLGFTKELGNVNDISDAADAAIDATAQCFPYAPDKAFISYALTEFLKSKVISEHKISAANALRTIYPHANPETYEQIQSALVFAFLFHPSVEVRAAQIIHDLAFDVNIDIEGRIKRVLAKAESTAPKPFALSTTIYLQAMPIATSEDLADYSAERVQTTVHDFVITFCADTFYAKIMNEVRLEAGKRSSASMQRKQ